ncbi:MAG: hypothetical protein WC569_01775 [Candidatus Omnitrophota bacterium]
MKKITLIVQSKDADETLEAVKRLGVLHVQHENPPEGIEVARRKDELALLSKAINLLPEADNKKQINSDYDEIIEEIINLSEEKELLLEDLKKIDADISSWREWGDFDPDIIEDLRDKGIWVRLCEIDSARIDDVPEGAILEKFFRKGNAFYCAVISRQEVKLDFKTIEPPEAGLEEMRSLRKEREGKIKDIAMKLTELSAYRDSLVRYGGRLQAIIELNEVRSGMGKFEKLSYLKGYAPSDKAVGIEKTAAKENWGLVIEDPEDSDNPPTLIRNPGWIEIIKPVFKIINTIPGYREVDISPHFLLFFCLFFGMLIGDAGYGLVYMFIAALSQWKLKNLKDRKIFYLAYLLSSFAIAWGLITGVFFGPHPWLKPLVPYFSNEVNVQSFCFLIGAVQLSLAHLWKFLRKWPSLKALSDAGWILILWAAYFLANTLILVKEFPAFAKWGLIIGAPLVILFTSPDKNILKGIGAGMGDFLLKIMNSFGDIVSYIRLFAVGAAGVAIAASFNQMAANIGNSAVSTALAGAIILFLGHTLNIVMGILAILVHGVRLNVLEFSGHLDIEWSGAEYAPFKEA